ncbi:MAG: riboflavin synthase [Flavitalea sp.]
MFTGIVESTGIVTEIIQKGTNFTYWIESPLSKELKVDQSLSHSGVCLTVEEIRANSHRVTAIEETLRKTSLQSWKTGTVVNLERCLPMNGRLDGHFVQGHVDSTGTCISRENMNGSWEFRFAFPEEFAALVIEKGSVSMNGISLTIFNITLTEFTVAIIPYTFEHTNIRDIHPGDIVNLEFDVIGKYLLRKMQVG